MRRPLVRLLLVTALTGLIGEWAISSRAKNRPSLVQPRVVESNAPGAPMMQGAGLPPGVMTPRMQETTIRPPAAQTPAYVPSQIRPLTSLSQPEVMQLVEEAISKTERRYLDVAEYTPWQIMHGVLALRTNYKLKSGDKLVNGIEYVSSGPQFRGEFWWEKTPFGGRGHPFTVPYAFEGHINQFPALLCMAALPPEHQLVAKGGVITIADMVENAKMTANTQEEISWTLWFLTQYVDQDAKWVNQKGQPWSMAELVRIQVADGVNDAPCGGTHGLFALAFARNAYLRKYGKLQGPWMNAEYKIRQHIELCKNLQNPDGSLSNNWFKGRGYSADFKDRIKTSGHQLEWLMMALPSSQLDDLWVRRAVQSVAQDLIRNATAPAECGPMYHALHALVLYRERMKPHESPATPAPAADLLAEQPARQTGTPPSPPSTPRAVAGPASPAKTMPGTDVPPLPSPSVPAQSAQATVVPPAVTATPPAAFPPDAAPPLAQPNPPSAAAGSTATRHPAAVLTAPSMLAPGLGYLSPAAPNTIAGAPSTGASTGSPPAGPGATPPAIFGAANARPLAGTPDASAGSTAANAAPPATAEKVSPAPAADASGPRPLLVLKQPVVQPREAPAQPAAAPPMASPAPAEAAAPATPPATAAAAPARPAEIPDAPAPAASPAPVTPAPAVSAPSVATPMPDASPAPVASPIPVANASPVVPPEPAVKTAPATASGKVSPLEVAPPPPVVPPRVSSRPSPPPATTTEPTDPFVPQPENRPAPSQPEPIAVVPRDLPADVIGDAPLLPELAAEGDAEQQRGSAPDSNAKVPGSISSKTTPGELSSPRPTGKPNVSSPPAGTSPVRVASEPKE